MVLLDLVHKLVLFWPKTRFLWPISSDKVLDEGISTVDIVYTSTSVCHRLGSASGLKYTNKTIGDYEDDLTWHFVHVFICLQI